MSYIGSGQYQAFFTADIDTFYVEADVNVGNSYLGEYFFSHPWPSGTPIVSRVETTSIWFNYCDGCHLGPLPRADNVSARFSGYITFPAPSVKFHFGHDDGIIFTISGTPVDLPIRGSFYSASDWKSGVAGQTYPFTLDWNNYGGPKVLTMSWEYSGVPSTAVPTSALSFDEGSSLPRADPSQITISYNDIVDQNQQLQVVIQNRDGAGNINVLTTSSYTVRLVRTSTGYSDANCSGGSCTASAHHTSQGSYSATLTPLVAGDYNLEVTLDGSAISGSPFAVTVNCVFQSWSISNMDVELTVQKTVSISVSAVENSHNFCAISLSSDSTHLITFTGHSMDVLTSDLLMNAKTHTVEVTASFDNQPSVTTSKKTFTVSVYACDTHNIVSFTIDSIEVEMGYTFTETLSPTHDNNVKVPTLDCPLSLSTPDGTDFLTFNGFEMAVYTVNPNLFGDHTLTVRVTKSGEGVPEYLDVPVALTVIPSCTLSALQQVSPPALMSTPIFGSIFQDIAPLFTHEHVDIWPVGTCIIAFYIQTGSVSGDTSYLTCISEDENKPLLKTKLHFNPYIYSDEGTHLTQVVAFYLEYTDQVTPPNELASDTFQVIVEEECQIVSYANDPLVSTVLVTQYTVNDPELLLPFDIPYQPAICNYITDYSFVINEVVSNPPPSWLSIDTASDPHQVRIWTDNVVFAGIYQVSITEAISSIPKFISTEPYNFQVTIAFDNCATLVYDTKSFSDLPFEISDGAPASTFQFTTHTDFGGAFNCGSRLYNLVQSYPGVTFEGRTDLVWNEDLGPYASGDQLSFSFQTTNPADVGSHEIMIAVKSADYPEWNSVITLPETFNLVVTAACWSTVFYYETPFADHVQIVNQATSTINLAPVKDSVSDVSTPMDGYTYYCGPRTFTHVSVTSSDHEDPIDSSWLTFDDVGFNYAVESTNDAHWGIYEVTFGVELDLYPDFTRQDFTISVEIVPDCENSSFIVAQSITLLEINRSQVINIDFAGLFSYELEGAYNSYCGMLEYVLDPSGLPVQSYLSYDDGTVLTFAPEVSDPVGVFGHTLRVRLAQYPNNFHDEPFSVDIQACDITAFYVDTVSGAAIATARENSVVGSTEFVIFQDAPLTYDFSFDDFEVAQSSGCESVFEMKYVLYVDGVDVSQNVPSWVTDFDPSSPSVTVEFTDPDAIGLHTLTVFGELQLNPTPLLSATQIDFTFEAVVDPCDLISELYPPVIPDIEFEISSDAEPTVYIFDDMTNDKGDCGPIDYEISGTFPENTLSIDSDSRTLTLQSSSGLDVGTHVVQLTGTVRNYPSNVASADFNIVITSVCTETVLFARPFNSAIFWEGNDATEVDLTISDRKSLQNGGDGSTLCGPRKYEVVTDKVKEKCYVSVLLNVRDASEYTCDDPYPEFELYRTDDNRNMLKFPSLAGAERVRDILFEHNTMADLEISVSLVEYPDVPPATINIKTYKMKSCQRQIIMTKNRIKDAPKILFATIGAPAKQAFLDSFKPENEKAFEYFGDSEMANVQHCGPVAYKMHTYDYYLDTKFHWWSNDFYGPFPDKPNFLNLDLVDFETPIPRYLSYRMNEFSSIQVSIQSNDDNLVGEHYFILFVSLKDYPQTDRESKRLYQVHAVVRITFTARIEEGQTIDNKKPRWTKKPKCQHNVIEVQEKQPAGVIDNGGHKVYYNFGAADPDYDSVNFFASFMPTIIIDASTDQNLSLCANCVVFDSSMGIHQYEKGEEFPFVVGVSGVPGNEFEQLVFTITYSDIYQSIQMTVYTTFVPIGSISKLTNSCLTRDEVLIQLGQKEETKKEETNVVSSVNIVVKEKIVVEEIQTEEKVDINEFIGQMHALQSQGADFSVGSNLYAWAMKNLRKVPYALPILITVTYTGRAIVHFSQPLKTLPNRQDLAAHVELMILEGWLTLSLRETNNSDQVTGESFFDPTYFNKDEKDSTSSPLDASGNGDNPSTRRLQSKPEKAKDDFAIKDFRWAIASLTKNELQIQLEFTEPRYISIEEVKDRLQLRFVEVEKFLGILPLDLEDINKLIFKQQTVVKRQNDQKSVQQAQEASQQITSFMQGATLVKIIASAFQSQSLQNLWGSISSLQLTVHIPLNNISLPTNVEILFGALIKVVTFDVLESLDELGYGLEYDASPTMPFSSGFETLGYDSSEPIGLLGTINFLLALVLLQVLWFFTPRVFCFKYCRGRGQPEELSANLVRFFIQLTFELLICAGAVFFPRESPTLLDIEEKTNFDKFLIAYAAFIAFITFSFITLTVYVTNRYPHQVIRRSQQIRRIKNMPRKNALKSKKAMTVEQVTLSENRQWVIRKLSESYEAELEKIKHFVEFFAGVRPHSRLAYLYTVIFLWRRLLIVLIAVQMSNVPTLQLGCLTLLCVFNLVYLMSTQVFDDRVSYLLETINDVSVYIAVVHFKVLLVTVTNFDAYDATGFSLIAFVSLNLTFNMLHIILSICKDVKKSIKMKYEKIIRASRSWDSAANASSKFQCTCKCYSCGYRPTKTTAFSAAGMKLLKPVSRSASDFKLTLIRTEIDGFEIIPMQDEKISVKQNQVAPASSVENSIELLEDPESDRVWIKSKMDLRREKRLAIKNSEARPKHQRKRKAIIQQQLENTHEKESIGFESHMNETPDKTVAEINVDDTEKSPQTLINSNFSSPNHSRVFDNDEETKLDLTQMGLNPNDSTIKEDDSNESEQSSSSMSSSSSESDSSSEEADDQLSLKQSRYRSWIPGTSFGDIDFSGQSQSSLNKVFRFIEQAMEEEGDSSVKDEQRSDPLVESSSSSEEEKEKDDRVFSLSQIKNGGRPSKMFDLGEIEEMVEEDSEDDDDESSKRDSDKDDGISDSEKL